MFPVLILILSLCFAALAWRNLRLALIVLAGLLPTYLIRFSLGPIPFTLLEIFILTTAAVWLIRHRDWKLNLSMLRTWGRPLLLLLAAASFGVAVSLETFAALGIWKAYFIEPALVFLMMHTVLKNTHDWHLVLRALAFSGIVTAMFALAQFATGAGIPEPWDIERRVTGLFDYPNALGLFLAPIVGLSTVMLLRASTLWRWFWALTICTCGVAIILAQTEAALVAIPAGLLLTLGLSGAKKKVKLRVMGEAILIFTIACLLFTSVSEKLLLQDYSGQVRLSQWSETTTMLVQQPAFGAGLSGYPSALEPYHDPTLFEIFQYPHTILLNIWSELGLLGLVAFFWLAALTLKTLRENKDDTLKLAAFSALAIMTIHGLVDVPYFKNDLAVMTWILIAIMSIPIPLQKKIVHTKQHCGC